MELDPTDFMAVLLNKDPNHWNSKDSPKCANLVNFKDALLHALLCPWKLPEAMASLRKNTTYKCKDLRSLKYLVFTGGFSFVWTTNDNEKMLHQNYKLVDYNI